MILFRTLHSLLKILSSGLIHTTHQAHFVKDDLSPYTPAFAQLLSFFQSFSLTEPRIYSKLEQSYSDIRICQDKSSDKGTIMENIGCRIKELRGCNSLSLTKLAKSIGISPGNLSDIENNKNMPSTKAAILISEHFNVSLDWLLTGKGEMFLSSGNEPEDKQEDNSELLSLKKRYDQLERVYNDLKKSIDQSEKEYSLLSTKNQELNQELFTRLKELLECKDLIIKLQKN